MKEKRYAKKAQEGISNTALAKMIAAGVGKSVNGKKVTDWIVWEKALELAAKKGPSEIKMITKVFHWANEGGVLDKLRSPAAMKRNMKSMKAEMIAERHRAIEELSLEGKGDLTRKWGMDVGILGSGKGKGKGTPKGQAKKRMEEATELTIAIAEGDHDGIIDGIGDELVTLELQAAMAGLTLSECWAHALNIILDRDGEMVNGQFVKQS